MDLLIDSRQALIKTREGSESRFGDTVRVCSRFLRSFPVLTVAWVTMRSGACPRPRSSSSVWKERYRPEAHDNKLYYNINRLRKLIEPDVRKPQYLLNWKEGYRLAPGLRIQFVGGRSKRGTRKQFRF